MKDTHTLPDKLTCMSDLGIHFEGEDVLCLGHHR